MDFMVGLVLEYEMQQNPVCAECCAPIFIEKTGEMCSDAGGFPVFLRQEYLGYIRAALNAGVSSRDTIKAIRWSRQFKWV
jgi:hypothetical protein